MDSPALLVVLKLTVCFPLLVTTTDVPLIHVPPSTLYCVEAMPEVVSKALAVMVTGEVYQLLFPSVPDAARESEGADVSIFKVVTLLVVTNPALFVVRN